MNFLFDVSFFENLLNNFSRRSVFKGVDWNVLKGLNCFEFVRH